MNAHEMVAEWDRRQKKSTEKTRSVPNAPSLHEYLKNAPSHARMDQIHSLAAQGRISVIRQVRPGVYVYVFNGSYIVEPKG